MTTPDTSPARLSPDKVAALSDADLSVRLAEALGWKLLPGTLWVDREEVFYLLPSVPASVEHVREHMRERWRETAPDPIYQLDWYICGWGDYYSVGQHHCGGSGAEFPLHNAALVKRESLGRAVFESALLSKMQEQMQPPVSQATLDNEMERAQDER
jgi:hypothetical protein